MTRRPIEEGAIERGAAEPGAPRADLLAEVLDRLAAGGGRLTRPRRAVVGALLAADRPLAVGEIVEASGVPQSSAYRILVDLVARRLVVRIAGTDDLGRYELGAEVAGRHHHLMCSDCGLVVDVDLPADLEDRLARSALDADPAFAIDLERFDLVGRCAACR